MRQFLKSLCGFALTAFAAAALGQSTPCSTSNSTCVVLNQEVSNASTLHYAVLNKGGIPVLFDYYKGTSYLVPNATITTNGSGLPVVNPHDPNLTAMDLPANGSVSLASLSSVGINPANGYTVMIAGYPKVDTSNLSKYSTWATVLDNTNSGALVTFAQGPSGWALGRYYELSNSLPNNPSTAYFESPWDPPTAQNVWQNVFYTFSPDGKCRIDVLVGSINGSSITYQWFAGIVDGGHPNAVNNSVSPQAVYPAGTLTGSPATSSINPPNDVRWAPGTLVIGYPQNGNGTVSYTDTVQRALGIGVVEVFKVPLTTDQILAYQSLTITSSYQSNLAPGMEPCNTGNFLNVANPKTYMSYVQPVTPCSYSSNWAVSRTVPSASITQPGNFGSVNVGSSSATVNATISNTSATAPLNIGPILLSDAPNSNFQISANGAGQCVQNQTIAVGQSCKIGVTFVPTTSGALTATATIKTNIAASGSQLSLKLAGTGVGVLPGPVTNLVSGPQADGLVASWNPPTVTGGFVTYDIALVNDTVTEQILWDQTVTSVSFTGLNPGKNYWVVVYAVNTYGQGPSTTGPIVNPGAVNWVYCGSEGGTCSISQSGLRGGQNYLVQYTANGNAYYQYATGDIPCNNSVFGDPAYGYGKTCNVTYSSNLPLTPPSSQPVYYNAQNVLTAVAGNWVFCSYDGTYTGASCNLPQNGWLAYGASDGNGGGFLYTPTSSASTFPCSLNSWGYDPAPGRDKACFFKPQTPAASGAVTNASITPQPGSALVSWQPPSYQGSTYTSYYTVGLAQSGVAISTASLPATSTSYTVPGLVYGANYQITINACNDIGCSPWTGNVVPNQFSIAHCAYEGQTCSVGQPVTINYYYYNSYYNCIYNFNASACNWYGYADGILRQNYAANQTINCSNAGFSGDPSYGNGKSCDWTPANQFPAGPMGYTTPNVYNYCIDEGGSCDLPNNTPNGVTVWFGRTIQGQSMSANWYSRSYPSSATSTTCVASNFNAPASSVTRSCFYVIN